MSTALLGFLLAASPAPAATERVAWLSDYNQARDLGVKDQKPLVVVVGTGGNGWEQLLHTGFLSETASENLLEAFVCLYVDTDTDDGKELAKSLGVPTGPGIVITDRTGKLQALRYRGQVSTTDLQRVLSRFGSPDFVVRTTETDVRPPAPPPRPAYTPAMLNFCPT